MNIKKQIFKLRLYLFRLPFFRKKILTYSSIVFFTSCLLLFFYFYTAFSDIQLKLISHLQTTQASYIKNYDGLQAYNNLRNIKNLSKLKQTDSNILGNLFLDKNSFQIAYRIAMDVMKNKSFEQALYIRLDSYINWEIRFVKNAFNLQSHHHIFAALSLIEFYCKLDYSLSVQYVIDCCKTCSSPIKVINFVLARKFISQQMVRHRFEPWIIQSQANPTKCQQIQSLVNRKYKYKQLHSNQQMWEQITNGPMLAAVDRTRWIQYQRGIFNICDKIVTLNHYVLIVGKGVGFWKILNSWGPKWGEKGFMRLSINACGLSSKVFTLQLL